jgi:transcriptional regulator with XRE-family HTH domain
MENIEAQIDRLKKAANVSKNSELAEILGERPTTISSWKQRGIPEGKLHRAANILNCSVEWIRKGVGEVRPAKETVAIEHLDPELARLALATVKGEAGEQQVELTIEEVTRELMIRSLPEEVRKSIDHAIQSAWAAEQAKQSK